MSTAASSASGAPVVSVKNLGVDFWVDGTWYPAVVGAEFDLRAGEVLAIVGESGSGKSTTAMSLLGLLPKNSHVSGSIELGGRQLVGADARMLRSIRGREISVIFQEPMTALNPVYTIGFQIAEMLRSHFAMAPSAARKRAIELLSMVEIPDPERRVDSYPHQLSGGQRQRAMIAQALACDPELLVADEPTTALDVTVQAEILKLMRDLKNRIDAAIVLITHDMGVVADLADRLLVMKDGRIVESGTADEVFHRPQHPYTIQLLDAVPHLGAVIGAERETDRAGAAGSGPLADGPAADGATLGHGGLLAGSSPLGGAETSPRPAPSLQKTASGVELDPSVHRAGLAPGVPAVVELDDVAIEYPKRGRSAAFRAVEGMSLRIGEGEVVGLVGESGSGKTTVGRALVGLLPFVQGQSRVVGHDLVGIKPKDLRQLRRDVSFVFQDPGSSLNPRFPVGESIGEPLLLNDVAKGADLSKRVEALLDKVQLPRAMRNRYPHELSGGQRQRIGIARALALEPKLLIADEPTSALDVSVQAKVLQLFQDLQASAGFACLFISHDLAVVEILSRRIAVMHHGRLVELGTREQILTDPQRAYTRRLLAAVPVPDPDEQARRRAERDALLAAGVGTDDDGPDRRDDEADAKRRAEADKGLGVAEDAPGSFAAEESGRFAGGSG
ncbi:ABC transporter ATP-binding protein [Nakamurella flavida]|uniref:ABC transporter ATP-binding protein n=1 Tax=Nakamurella flavida TaxID=363630 RepID=A0A938YPQ1_9ACTN|nr:ABC transporter ATP-binding protein [Nakamurella flavida]MBM9476948.1 ABC transporter ATP-binding protein [Nakamurella flavida]MDP9779893.1 peptide/nickel transport system ATP-binding protein [Nakamurella flavida]